ncbi:MAG TPA: hypothetical protein VGI48_18290 [Caldimonas sp.]|jgi:hypothetical protein
MAANDTALRGESLAGPWTTRLAILCAALVVVLGTAYLVRRTLLLSVARVFLERDAELVSQEKSDGVAIVFAKPQSPWIRPMKNVMNPMWQSIGAEGVNYYTFAGPSNLFRSYSERSDPASPYYQAWVGAYVTKRRDATLPQDLPAWAKQVTELDQRSWLAAMGDPRPLAESAAPTRAGSIVIDGRSLELWHGAMRSHSDLSEKANGPLATLVGMPTKSLWPAGVRSFHDVTLDGYFVCWADATRRIAIVVYAVSSVPADQPTRDRAQRRDITGELLSVMKTARLETVR